MPKIKLLIKIGNSVEVRECKGAVLSNCGKCWEVKFKARGVLESIPIGQVIGFGVSNV